MILQDLFLFPFRFNPLKHHHKWMLNHIEFLLSHPEDKKSREELVDQIKSVNSNYIDIYTGVKTPKEIIVEIHQQLEELQVLKMYEFSLWLKHKEYQLLSITDGSIWVLREGMDEERFIHIHPARNAPHIVRLHGNSWKTAVVSKIFGFSINTLNVTEINDIRRNILDLSPVKNLDKSQRLMPAFRLLQM